MIILSVRITVLRLSHRPERDKRITTHVCLVARAFGADKVIYTGIRDRNLEESIQKIVKRWGGKFSIKYTRSWREVIQRWKNSGGIVVHLTMYGINLPDNGQNKECQKRHSNRRGL